MLKTKTSAVLSLLLVFASGALLGILGYRVYLTNQANAAKEQPKKREPRDWRTHFLADLKQKLKLNDQQAASLDRIFKDTDQEYRTNFSQWNQSMNRIQESLVARINSLLSPEQQALYKQFRDERERERERRRPPGPPRPRQ